MIHVGRPLQLSESREQFSDVLLSDAFPSVFYLASQYTSAMIIGQVDFNFARVCEFERVLNQVDQNLLEASLVAVKKRNTFTKARFIPLVPV